MRYSGLLSKEEVFCDLWGWEKKIPVIVGHVMSEEEKRGILKGKRGKGRNRAALSRTQSSVQEHGVWQR
jgi:hypothetical protein